MSVLQLYHGDKVEFRYTRRLGSPYSAVLLVNGVTVLRAGPDGFIALRQWLVTETEALRLFMDEPEDPRVAENLRGDMPGEGG